MHIDDARIRVDKYAAYQQALQSLRQALATLELNDYDYTLPLKQFAHRLSIKANGEWVEIVKIIVNAADGSDPIVAAPEKLQEAIFKGTNADRLMSVDEALADPAAFVEGMVEEGVTLHPAQAETMRMIIDDPNARLQIANPAPRQLGKDWFRMGPGIAHAMPVEGNEDLDKLPEEEEEKNSDG